MEPRALRLLQHAFIKHLLDYRHPGKSWRHRGKYLRCGPCAKCGLVQREGGVGGHGSGKEQKEVQGGQCTVLDRERRETGWSGKQGWLRKAPSEMKVVESHKGLKEEGCCDRAFFRERPPCLWRGEWVHGT